MTSVSIFVALLLRLATSDVIFNTSKHDQWAYAVSETCDSGTTMRCGPNQWQMTPGSQACGEVGTQSPIDVVNAVVQYVPVSPVVKVTNGFCPNASYILNEHTSEVEFDLTCPNVFQLEYNSAKYSLKQFHFHSPSENQLDGGYFPMEVHAVHVNPTTGQALVISMMVAVGTPTTAWQRNQSAFLETVMSRIPSQMEATSNYYEVEVEGELKPYDQLIPDLSDVLFWVGSFTTPPCTTNTIWFMPKEPILVSQAFVDQYRASINNNPNNQLATFAQINNNTNVDLAPAWNPLSGMTAAGITWNAELGCNNRPIQPLNSATTTRAITRFMVGQAASSSTSTSTTTAEASSFDSASSLPMWAWLLLGALVLLACIAMAMAMCMHKPKKAQSKKRALKPAKKQEVPPPPPAPVVAPEPAPTTVVTAPPPAPVQYTPMPVITTVSQPVPVAQPAVSRQYIPVPQQPVAQQVQQVQTYAAPQAYAAPQTYAAPQAYASPPHTYAAPPQTYAAPPQTYSQTVPTYQPYYR